MTGKPELIRLLEAELYCEFMEVSENEILILKHNRTTDYSIDYEGNVIGLSIQRKELKKIPESFTGESIFLGSITLLNLSNNEIVDISPIGIFRNLVKLHLRNNELTNISSLESLKKLEELNLAANQITDISALKEYSKIVNLNLSTNELTDVYALKNLVELTELNLSYNPLTSISPIRELTKLEKLHLSAIRFNEYSVLENLVNLKYLDLSTNRIVDLSSSRTNDLSPFRKLRNLEELNLSSCRITDISPLNCLENLSVLNLTENKISDIIPLVKLHKLKNLSLNSNFLSDISPIQTLDNLESLNLSNNNINDLSYISSLFRLRSLALRNNKITNIEFLADCKSLTDINLGNNDISEISPLLRLNNLIILNLEKNKISDISPLTNLLKIKELNISFNKITDVTPLKGLKELIKLELDNNMIESLPEWITDFPHMEINWTDSNLGNGYIKIFNNPMEESLISAITQGKETLRGWFEQIKKYGKGKAFEAKILIVGEPGSGKTTLLRKLFDPDIEVPSKVGEQPSTLGIEVCKNRKFPYFKDPGIEISTYIWDFGGQDIQYALHQYFITDNSLFILLSDGRKDNTRYDYWFQTIQMLSKNSPVVVCINKKEGATITPFDRLNYTRLFPQLNICDLEVDFRKNDFKWDYLLKTIAQKLSELKVVGQENPKAWNIVKEKLDEIREKSKYIDLRHYREICTWSGITSNDDSDFLLTYLHDIGEALNFKGDPALARMVFLDPNWITKAIYEVLSDEIIEKQDGTYQREWLFKLWKAKGYESDECNDLLNLMLKDKFNLCYKLTGKSDTYMVPLKLPQIIPEYHWNIMNNLNFRYQYPFMPEGLLSQLIVQVNEYIEGHLVWGKGVVIRKNSCRAEIQQTYNPQSGLKYIGIRVESNSLDARKELLKYIRFETEKIHRISFPTMKVSEMVVCNCPYCSESEDPSFYEYSELRDLMEMGEIIKPCLKSRRTIHIREMIDATFTKGEFDDRGNRITIPPTAKPKILYLAASPDENMEETGRLDLKNEYKKIKDSLRFSHFYELTAPELDLTVEDFLWEMGQNPAIVHFSGHAEDDGILLENEDNSFLPVAEDFLVNTFQDYIKTTRLLVLCACNTSSMAKQISGLGFYVIGMNNKIRDLAAVRFSSGLYIGLSQGKDIAQSFISGVSYLMAYHHDSKDIPELWKGGKLIAGGKTN